ncbi:MAG: pyridoxal phosphate-dependent aminotransferase [Alphaproteobacteria bacterium]|nr:pyridoxal phosphate-dependent aminotransferase [Alphaproteobacteria bacterium]
MLLPSKRGAALPASPIRKLVPFAEQAKAKGIKVYHLNIGQPDIKTPQIMLEAVKHNHLQILEYTHSAGNASYRKKLAAFYTQQNIPLTQEEIIITTGGSEAIIFAFMACLDIGDEVIVPEPFYANYNSFALLAGVTIIPVTSVIENGFALPPIEKFEEKINAKTKAIVLCNPNNPTGYVYTPQELSSIKNLVLKYNLFLFSDEAYREFCYEGKAKSCLELEGIEDRVVVMDTISKRYSACGVRIGAFISRNKAVVQAALKIAQARLSPPGYGQIAGEAALDLPDNFFDDIKNEYQLRRDFLVKRLLSIPDVFCTAPAGAFYIIAKLPLKDADHFCQWMLEHFEYQKSTVMLAPASGFYSNPATQGKNEVRLAYVLNRNDLEMAMHCFEKGLEAYKLIVH